MLTCCAEVREQSMKVKLVNLHPHPHPHPWPQAVGSDRQTDCGYKRQKALSEIRSFRRSVMQSLLLLHTKKEPVGLTAYILTAYSESLRLQ